VEEPFLSATNVHGIHDMWQTEEEEPLEPEPSIKVEMVFEKLKRHKSPGTDQIPVEMIKTGGKIIHSKIHKLLNSIWNK
jgi:hypothetical protein